MSEILFIRHAETDMAGTFCGHSDPNLNAQGRIQVGELIDQLRSENIGAVYTSDLQRAQQTALALATAFRVECHLRAALREIDFGHWEGLRWEEIERQDADYARRWIAGYPNLPAPDGESFDSFERRVFEEVNFLVGKTEDTDCSIAVVTHAGVLRSVLRILHGCSQEDAWERTRSYCSLVRYPTPALVKTVEYEQ
jgi:alpha-ribazole phosphatase